MQYRIEIDDELLRSLRLCAAKTRTSVSALLRNAIQDYFPYDPVKRRGTLHTIPGLWAERNRSPGRTAYIPASFWSRGLPAPAKEPRVVLADTEILTEVMRGRDRILANQWLDSVERGTAIVCSAVSLAEIWRTAPYHQLPHLNPLCSAMLCLPADSEVSRLAGELTHRAKSELALTLPDAILIATAVLHECELWTRGHERFPRGIVNFFKPPCSRPVTAFSH